MTENEPNKLAVMLVDDQALVRSGFRMLIDAEDDMEVVAEASDGNEALDVLAKQKVDVVLMDIRMPGLDGGRDHQANRREEDSGQSAGADHLRPRRIRV